MNSELQVVLLQTELAWENPVQNRKMFSEKIEKIPEGTHLVVLPEMFTSGFTMQPDNLDPSEGARTIEWMREKASDHQTAITGSVAVNDAGNYYNRLYFVKPDGTLFSYDKRHTFTLAGEDKVYVAGKDKGTIEYLGFRIRPNICYDLRFPVWSRNTEHYDVLLYVANWPTPRIQAWDTLLKARAIENMAYCIGVNRLGEDPLGHRYNGHSAVYDCLGSPLAYSEVEGLLKATLTKRHVEETRKKLKFLDDRDRFTLEP